jgi:ferredoxin--NADP+ reductase
MTELASLEGVGVSVDGYIAKRSTKKGDFIATFSRQKDPNAKRHVVFTFCVSPRELQGTTRVTAVKIERNDLFESAAGMRAVGSGECSILPAGLVVRAIGYQAQALEGVPLVEATGTVPNSEGRVLSSVDGPPIQGLYVAGWIKRGPTGLIGTNKACSVATVDSMERDLDQIGPERDDGSIRTLLESRGAQIIDYQDWRKLDEFEMSEGAKLGSVRKKLLSVQAALEVLGRGSTG